MHSSNRYRLYTVCTDQSGLINIIFPDREVRRLTANNVFDLELEEAQVRSLHRHLFLGIFLVSNTNHFFYVPLDGRQIELSINSQRYRDATKH